MPFPLPLVPFEENMLLDDRVSYPMTFFIRLRFMGCVERQRLEQAIEVAQGCHPLLAARVESPKKSRWRWVDASTLRPQIVWNEGQRTDDFPQAQHLRLDQEVGLRVIVVAGDTATDLVLQFHHSCCDAIGAMQFVEDLLSAYALPEREVASSGDTSRSGGLQLTHRTHFAASFWQRLKIKLKQLKSFQGVLQFVRREPVPIIPYSTQPDLDESPPEYPAALVARFNASETQAIRAVAKENGVTINDLMARDLFLAMSDWRRRHRIGSGSDWLRLAVPMNLRNQDHAKLSAANVVSMVFLDRRDPQFDDDHELLKSVHEEMSLIKRWQLGYTYLLSLQVLKLLPWGLSHSTQPDQCFSSAVLSNLGKVLDRLELPRNEAGQVLVDDLVLEDVDFLAPIRPLTCTTFSLVNYSQHLNIGLHFDPRPLSRKLAKDLLETYVQYVRKSIVAASRG